MALMKLSAWHKQNGDHVEWWDGFHGYDKVYMSKVFSDAYSEDELEPCNANEIVRGGTGYAISLEGRVETYDSQKDQPLPPEVERMTPDYSLYPQFDFAVSFTSRGCPRGCGFCHVAAKEGRCSVKVADVAQYWTGQKKIQVLDPNITACKDKRDLFRQYRETGARICFNQGLDIRLTNDDDINDINAMKLDALHFAWDNPLDDLQKHFMRFAKSYKGSLRNTVQVFLLTGYEDCTTEEHIERALYRLEKLKECGDYNPYVMVYDKPHADKRLLQLQRWCNNKFIYRSCPNFADYNPSKKA